MTFLYLTNPGHPGDFELSTAGAFQCPLTEKEVNIMSNVETFYKVHVWLKEKEELQQYSSVNFKKVCVGRSGP